jgi:hypothetical protein
VRRIIRANDPFDIDQIVRPEEYINNRAVKMAAGMLSDSGYTIRHELPSDRTIEPLDAMLNNYIKEAGPMPDFLVEEPTPVPSPPAEPRYAGKRGFNPVEIPEDFEMHGVTAGTDNIYGGV